MNKILVTTLAVALLGGCADRDSSSPSLAMAEKLVALHKEAQQQGKQMEINGDGPFSSMSRSASRGDAKLWDMSIENGVLVIKPSRIALEKQADAADFAFYVAPQTIKYIQRGRNKEKRYYRVYFGDT